MAQSSDSIAAKRRVRSTVCRGNVRSCLAGKDQWGRIAVADETDGMKWIGRHTCRRDRPAEHRDEDVMAVERDDERTAGLGGVGVKSDVGDVGEEDGGGWTAGEDGDGEEREVGVEGLDDAVTQVAAAADDGYIFHCCKKDWEGKEGWIARCELVLDELCT